MSEPIRIKLVNGPRDGSVLEFTQETITIGTSSDSDISLPWDALAAPEHAKIICKENQVSIQPLPGADTFVDDEKVEELQPIDDSHIMRIGHSELILQRELDAADGEASVSFRQVTAPASAPEKE
jgi:pSer/pThr/pTyr-binding forkhead associated (FHA) protein